MKTMAFKFEIAELLSKHSITEGDQKNLIRLFEFTQYLYDIDENLTKNLNLNKKAKDQLKQRMEEMFGISVPR